jgi:DNA-binding transcriptional MerR regulator
LTGVPAATLRAWERRYGIPAPRRSPAAYRIYSDRDVALVRELRALTDGGLAPSEAARRLREARLELAPPPVAQDAFEVVRERVLDAVERFDPDALDLELRRALILGSSVEVYERVLVPVMQAVGERWGSGDLSVAHEHLASEALRAVAMDLLRLARPARPSGQVVLACFADEQHALPLYGIAFRLVQHGLRPVVLGARTPPEAVALAVSRLRPALVGLSVTVTPPDAEVLVAAYAVACGEVPWIVGGSGAAALSDCVHGHGGHLVGPDGFDALLRRIGAS